MKSPNLCPSTLAYAISAGILTSSLLSTSAYASCSINSNQLTCDYTSSSPSTPYINNSSPGIIDLTANINGSWNFTGYAESIFSINAFRGNTTINFNGDITWSDVDYEVTSTTVSPGGYQSGAISIGNPGLTSNTGANINISSNSNLTLDLQNANYRTIGTSLATLLVQSYSSPGISINNDGKVSIKNSNASFPNTVITTVANNSDTSIINNGEITGSGSAQLYPTLRGLDLISNGNNTVSIKNNSTGIISTSGESSGSGTGEGNLTTLAIQANGLHKSINITNSGTISSTNPGNSPASNMILIRATTGTSENTFNITNTGSITGTNGSYIPYSIYLPQTGSLNLKNSGTIAGMIYTAGISGFGGVADTIENSGTISGDISTWAGNDTLKNTAGQIIGTIDLGTDDDSLILSGGTLGIVKLGDGNDIATITGGSAQNIDMGAGADTATWSGGSFTNFYGGDGADTLIISNGADWNNIQSINGANASGIDDTSIDTLAFTNFTGNYNATKSLNWEAVEARSNSRVTFTDPALVMSSALGAGLFARAGGSFVVNNGFNLTSALTIDAGGSYLFAPGSSTGASSSITGNVSNAGTLDIADSNTGSTLTITGDYAGNNGTLRLRTNLGGDNSATSRLIISGAASGSTEVIVTNLGGSGAQTTDGIRIIETSTSSAGAFSLAGNYVSAGAFEYALVQRNDSTGDNWYLASTYVTPQPQQPTVTNPVYTPNLGAMLANQRTANVAFTSTLEDREGAAAYQLQGRENGPWVRYQARKNAFHSLDHLHTRGHSNIVQVGNTVLSLGSESRFDLGVMGGYADARSDSKHRLTQRKARSDLHGYSVGAYATWYAEPELKRGFYLDSWLLWNHFNNSISTSDGQKLSYKSKGVTASIEVGTHLQLMDNWWLQPQAQVVYQGVKADNYRDQQNVTIKSTEANYQTRLGAKTYLDISSANGADYRPYVELNWLHNSKPYAVEIASTDYTPNGMKNVGELKVGLEGKLNANNQVWINTLYAAGSDSQKDYGINLGWKYSF